VTTLSEIQVKKVFNVSGNRLAIIDIAQVGSKKNP
jgi:hypothetical protein